MQDLSSTVVKCSSFASILKFRYLKTAFESTIVPLLSVNRRQNLILFCAIYRVCVPALAVEDCIFGGAGRKRGRGAVWRLPPPTPARTFAGRCVWGEQEARAQGNPSQRTHTRPTLWVLEKQCEFVHVYMCCHGFMVRVVQARARRCVCVLVCLHQTAYSTRKVRTFFKSGAILG